MAESINIQELRRILRGKVIRQIDKYSILKDIANLTALNRTIGQEFILRLLSRISDFKEFEEIIYSLVRQVGLFPYLNEDELSFTLIPQHN